MSLPYPQIDPVALELGPLVIRWYSLAYIIGIVAGWRLALKLTARSPSISRQHVDDFIVWLTLGILLGGRMGYVLFYAPALILENPLQVFMIWQGGMSFHGGLLGVIIALSVYSHVKKIPLLAISDLAACVTPIGLFLGRVANFINGELYGRVTDVPWAMVFPKGGPLPRHPSQLYEAGLEGILLFAVMMVMVYRTNALQKPGRISGVFILLYALSRFSVEFLREPDAHLGFITAGLSMGQLLSLAMAVIGILVLYVSYRRNP